MTDPVAAPLPLLLVTHSYQHFSDVSGQLCLPSAWYESPDILAPWERSRPLFCNSATVHGLQNGSGQPPAPFHCPMQVRERPGPKNSQSLEAFRAYVGDLAWLEARQQGWGTTAIPRPEHGPLENLRCHVFSIKLSGPSDLWKGCPRPNFHGSWAQGGPASNPSSGPHLLPPQPSRFFFMGQAG